MRKFAPPVSLRKIALVVAFSYSSLNVATAATETGFYINRSDINYAVNDSFLDIGPGVNSNNPSIFFNTSNSLTISFLQDEGVVNIRDSNWPESAIHSGGNQAVQLIINNGSLNIDMDQSAFDYWMGGMITASWGAVIKVDGNLNINLEDTSGFPNYYTEANEWAGNEAFRSEGTEVSIGKNVDISINRATWTELNSSTNTRFGSLLAGMLAANARDDEDNPQSFHEWNFGQADPENTLFKIHDINSGTNTGIAEAYGVWITTRYNTTTIHGQAEITDIHAFTHSDAEGFHAYAYGANVQGGTLNFEQGVIIKNISAISDSTVSNQYLSSFESGTQGEDVKAYALAAIDNGTINVNRSQNSQAVVQIENDVITSNGGAISAHFLNANSHFVGTTVNESSTKDGNVEFVFKDGAYWLTTASNTQAVDLSLNNATVYLNQTVDSQTKELAQDNTVALTLSKLSGENGVFHMSTSVEGAYGDSIKIEEGSGKHQLLLSSSGAEPTEEALNRALVTETNGSMELSLANEGGQVDLGNYVYDLATRQTDSGTEWYLSDNYSNPEPDPDPTPDPDPNPDPTPTPEPQPELSPSATAVLALAGSGSQTTQFLYSLSDLRKRMGDIRYGAADGLYASIRGGKDRISGFASTSYKNEYGALSIGYDRKIDENWILGFSFEAIEGEQTVKSNGYRADGEDSTQSLKAYATWFNSIGCYADFVIGLNRFEQDISTHMLDGTKVNGDFNSYGYGASAEVGKKFALGSDKTWFIEPQAQLAYYRVQGKNFSLSNGMTINQDNADSLTGRIGVVVGRTLLEPDGTGYQVSLKAGVNHEFLGDADIHVNGEKFTDDSLGTRAYYGLGADWYLSDNVRLYGHIEREKGARFTSEINAKVGVKYHF